MLSTETGAIEPGAPPRIRQAVERPRLIRMLRSGRAPCVVVVAPAGYGKTVLLSQWVEEDRRDVVWLTLDETYNDPGLLLGSLAAGLGRSAPLPEQVLAPLSGPPVDHSRVTVPRLCAAIAARDEPVNIVLSDVHAIAPGPALDCVARLAELLPEGSRLAISSRSEPEIGLGRLRVHGRIDEVGGAEMAMTRSEAGDLFAAAGIELSREQVIRLVEHTEGWPAALYLAALGMRGSDPDAFIAEFAGDERLLADYLQDEFLANLAADDRDFLVRASLLDRLNGSICDEVLGAKGSASRLRRLSRSNLLVSPVDSKDSEFRMHSLMREMLKSELHRLGGGEERELLGRAALWSRAHGEPDRAVEQAIASRDTALAAELIWELAGLYSTEGRLATLRAWLELFEDDQIAAEPGLALSAAIAALTEGDGEGVLRWSEAGSSLLGDDSDPSLRAAATALRLSADAGETLPAVADGVAALVPAMPVRSIWPAYCRMVEGLTACAIGDGERAEAALAEASRGGLVPAPSPQSIGRAALALIAIDEDRPGDAQQAVTESLARIELYGLEGYRGSALPLATAALVRGRHGDPDARGLLDAACALVDSDLRFNSWYAAMTRVTIARAQLEYGDRAAAREHILAAERFSGAYPEAVAIRRWLDAARLGLDGDGQGERPRLTPAERRLLRLMPTHRSFPEIAKELIVSTNTVKTQARSIYRKLGASSRSDAVGRARAAGLLDREPDAPRGRERG